jgi:hypothetical protein
MVMDKIRNNLIDYIKLITGEEINISIVNQDEIKSLPLFLRMKYDYMTGKLFNIQIVFIHIKGSGSISALELRKHIDLIRKALRKPVVFVTNALEAYNRKRLINKKIPFIVPGKQMFIPEMVISFQDSALRDYQMNISLTPAVQFLLLFHLLCEDLEGLNLKSIAKKLGYGKMTISRAVSYLSRNDICQVTGTKEKGLEFSKSKMVLWKEVEPLMSSPVKKIVFTDKIPELEFYKRSNINALAHYTDLADDLKDYVAIADPDFKKLMKFGRIKDYGYYDGEVCMEVWKYNPAGLSKDKYVDPLSLYLIFRNDEDERVQVALNKIMEGFSW